MLDTLAGAEVRANRPNVDRAGAKFGHGRVEAVVLRDDHQVVAVLGELTCELAGDAAGRPRSRV
jgi:hypothetical protein